GLNVGSAERALREQLIVRSTNQAQVRRLVRPAIRLRNDVVELEKRCRVTTLARSVDESALASIASRHLAPNGAGNVAGSRALVFRSWCPRWPSLRLSCLRRPFILPLALGLAEAFLLERRDEQIERTLEHRGQITRRISMAHQLGRLDELVFEFLT